MCSFNQLESIYNILLCYLFMNDKDNSIKQLNQLSTKLPDKHKKYLTLIRYVVHAYFDMSKEAELELKQFKSKEPALHDNLFTKGKTHELELFSVT